MTVEEARDECEVAAASRAASKLMHPSLKIGFGHASGISRFLCPHDGYGVAVGSREFFERYYGNSSERCTGCGPEKAAEDWMAFVATVASGREPEPPGPSCFAPGASRRAE